MFSQLGPLFRTTFRQAESADARLEIRRHEQDDGRKKREDRDEDGNSQNLWEDSMEVSLEALRTFLIDFLKNHGARMPDNVAADPVVVEPQPEERAPSSPMAARAAKAYGALSPQTHTPIHAAPLPDSTSVTKEPVAEEDLLESAQIREIHTLISDLDALSKAGVETLSVTMIGTFVESLTEAVRVLKSARPAG